MSSMTPKNLRKNLRKNIRIGQRSTADKQAIPVPQFGEQSMAAQTLSIAAVTTAYSLATSGQGNVLLQVHGSEKVRVHVGSSLPAADTDDWFALPINKSLPLDGLSSADNVYVRADSKPTTVQVVSWAADPTQDAGGVRPANTGQAVINSTGSSIAANKLVAISGLDTTSGLPKIVLADADVAAHEDVWVTLDAIDNTDTGVVYKGGLSAATLNTNSASTAGDPVYLSTTAGGFAHTAPSTGISRVHPVGMVVVKSATVGQILWDIGPVRKIGTNEIQAAVTVDHADSGLKVDGVVIAALKWVDVAVTAALLDSAGTVNVIAGVSGDQYKIRDIVLVGGGTNFAAGGDRLISLTDGTTVWTTIANADIESVPAASLRWGDAKVPFLTSKSNVASAAGQAIRFAYSGGTTDHSATGSITFSVCIEKVA
jgi:hypothetical protein